MNPTPAARRTVRIVQILQGVFALLVLLLLLGAVPVGLYVVGGLPLPHHLPSPADIAARLTQPDTDNTLFLSAVRLIGWAGWAIFAATTGSEALCFLQGRSPRRWPTPIRPLQHLARDLIATAALIVTTAGSITQATSTTGPHHSATATADPRDAAHPADASRSGQPRWVLAAQAAPPPGRPQQSPERSWRTYTIKRGDTLWAIARHAYGSGARYPIIFNANSHRPQPDGLPPITNPDLIFPHQHLKIPAKHINGSRNRTAPPSPPAQPRRPIPTFPTAPPPTTSTPPSPAPNTPTPQTPHPTPTSGRVLPTRPPAPGHSPAPSTRNNPRHNTTGPSEPAEHPDGPQVVVLRTGGYISLGLAAAISIALAATRLHRRRRRSHNQWPPDPTPEPAPPTPVSQARKAHMDALTDHGDPPPSDDDLLTRDFTTPPPTHLAIGARAKADITVELGGLNLALTGPGAPDVARAAVTELLARSRRSRVELVLPEADAAAILAGTGITSQDLTAAVPGLTVTASLDAAIAHLEAEFIHRARLMETLDITDVPALRTADPGEPLPALVLVATVPDHGTHGLEAILQLARPYCVGALLLGTWPPGTTLTVTGDGTITRADGTDADSFNDARLFHIAPGEAAALLRVIQTAHGTPEPGKPSNSTTGTGASPTGPTPDATGHAPPPADHLHEPAPEDRAAAVLPDRAVRASSERTPDDLPVHLRLLGTVQVQVTGVPITTGLRRVSYDLLAYLALNPDGITREQAIEDIWGDKTPEAGGEMWHTAINNIRKTLRKATNLPEPMFIIRTANRYRLDTALISVDAWQLLDVIRGVQQATNDAERLDLLKQIPSLYTAELATDLTNEWAETNREYLRRQGTDALAYLARLTQHHNPDQALAALEQAITHDPHAEVLYQSIMRIQARLNQKDAARRTYQLLETRLAELDVDPTEETRQLLITLLRPTSTGPPPPPARPASRK